MYRKYSSSQKDVLSLDIEVTKENLDDGVQELATILELGWEGKRIAKDDKSTGFMNENYFCHLPGETKGFLIRFVNPKLPEVLKMSFQNMKYLRRRGLGAALLVTFKNGLVMEWLEGESISWENASRIKDLQIWKGAARELARYHQTLNKEDIKELEIMGYKEINAYFDILSLTVYEHLPEDALKTLPSRETLIKAKSDVEEILEEEGAEISFAHNDMNPTNFIITEDGPVLIDYETCFMNFVVCNIAGFFGATIGDFTAGVDSVDFKNLPSEEEEDMFIREYLDARVKIDPSREVFTDRDMAHFKFLLRKGMLITYLNMVIGVLLTQSMMVKRLDIKIADLCWQKYLDNKDSVLTETFSYDGIQ